MIDAFLLGVGRVSLMGILLIAYAWLGLVVAVPVWMVGRLVCGWLGRYVSFPDVKNVTAAAGNVAAAVLAAARGLTGHGRFPRMGA